MLHFTRLFLALSLITASLSTMTYCMEELERQGFENPDEAEGDDPLFAHLYQSELQAAEHTLVQAARAAEKSAQEKAQAQKKQPAVRPQEIAAKQRKEEAEKKRAAELRALFAPHDPDTKNLALLIAARYICNYTRVSESIILNMLLKIPREISDTERETALREILEYAKGISKTDLSDRLPTVITLFSASTFTNLKESARHLYAYTRMLILQDLKREGTLSSILSSSHNPTCVIYAQTLYGAFQQLFTYLQRQGEAVSTDRALFNDACYIYIMLAASAAIAADERLKPSTSRIRGTENPCSEDLYQRVAQAEAQNKQKHHQTIQSKHRRQPQCYGASTLPPASFLVAAGHAPLPPQSSDSSLHQSAAPAPAPAPQKKACRAQNRRKQVRAASSCPPASGETFTPQSAHGQEQHRCESDSKQG